MRAIATKVDPYSSFQQEACESDSQGGHTHGSLCPEHLAKAKSVISLQQKAFPKVFTAIQAGMEIQKQIQLSKLSPYLDEAGYLRVGGHLSQADLESNERNLIILTLTI